MKTFLFLISIVFLISCDIESTLTHKIKKPSSENFILYANSGINEPEMVVVDKGNTEIWITGTYTGSPSKINLGVLYDSITLSVNNIPKIVYKKEKLGKNIYDYNHWIENKIGKRNYEYTFEITDEDLK